MNVFHIKMFLGGGQPCKMVSQWTPPPGLQQWPCWKRRLHKKMWGKYEEAGAVFHNFCIVSVNFVPRIFATFVNLFVEISTEREPVTQTHADFQEQNYFLLATDESRPLASWWGLGQGSPHHPFPLLSRPQAMLALVSTRLQSSLLPTVWLRWRVA